MSNQLRGQEKTYLKSLSAFFAKPPNDSPFAVLIEYPGHAVMVGHDGKYWLSVNHDRTILSDTLSPALLDNISTHVEERGIRCTHASMSILITSDMNDIQLPEPPLVKFSLNEHALQEQARRAVTVCASAIVPP